ncbi:MAG: prolyl oligopeptidase family serine peptidase [Sedimentisphaerales bacterium]|nr:prolyl oligopeptidase family serine peptidase [Sedimentisphaerales bacterium]
MKSTHVNLLLCVLLSFEAVCFSVEATHDTQTVEFARRCDVIYGRKYGMSLTMDVFTPENAKGIGILWVVSSSGRSDPTKIDKPSYRKCIQIFLNNGYTVFAVVHSSAPRFVLQDMVKDIHRAVRFVRFHANDFHIDPDHIGIAGASAGGWLAHLVGTNSTKGDPNNVDLVERVSSKIQVVGCFFPPTNWLDFDGQGTNVIDFQKTKYGFADPSFEFYDFDQDRQMYRIITDQKRIQELLKELSPISHVTEDDAPTLIIHGDADPFIPFRQSRRLIDRLENAGVPSKLITREGKGHGWTNWEKDVELVTGWFDQQLGTSK